MATGARSAMLADHLRRAVQPGPLAVRLADAACWLWEVLAMAIAPDWLARGDGAGSDGTPDPSARSLPGAARLRWPRRLVVQAGAALILCLHACSRAAGRAPARG